MAVFDPETGMAYDEEYAKKILEANPSKTFYPIEGGRVIWSKPIKAKEKKRMIIVEPLEGSTPEKRKAFVETEEGYKPVPREIEAAIGKVMEEIPEGAKDIHFEREGDVLKYGYSLKKPLPLGKVSPQELTPEEKQIFTKWILENIPQGVAFDIKKLERTERGLEWEVSIIPPKDVSDLSVKSAVQLGQIMAEARGEGWVLPMKTKEEIQLERGIEAASESWQAKLGHAFSVEKLGGLITLGESIEAIGRYAAGEKDALRKQAEKWKLERQTMVREWVEQPTGAAIKSFGIPALMAGSAAVPFPSGNVGNVLRIGFGAPAVYFGTQETVGGIEGIKRGEAGSITRTIFGIGSVALGSYLIRSGYRGIIKSKLELYRLGQQASLIEGKPLKWYQVRKSIEYGRAFREKMQNWILFERPKLYRELYNFLRSHPAYLVDYEINPAKVVDNVFLKKLRGMNTELIRVNRRFGFGVSKNLIAIRSRTPLIFERPPTLTKGGSLEVFFQRNYLKDVYFSKSNLLAFRIGKRTYLTLSSAEISPASKWLPRGKTFGSSISISKELRKVGDLSLSRYFGISEIEGSRWISTGAIYSRPTFRYERGMVRLGKGIRLEVVEGKEYATSFRSLVGKVGRGITVETGTTRQTIWELPKSEGFYQISGRTKLKLTQALRNIPTQAQAFARELQLKKAEEILSSIKPKGRIKADLAINVAIKDWVGTKQTTYPLILTGISKKISREVKKSVGLKKGEIQLRIPLKGAWSPEKISQRFEGRIKLGDFQKQFRKQFQREFQRQASLQTQAQAGITPTIPSIPASPIQVPEIQVPVESGIPKVPSLKIPKLPSFGLSRRKRKKGKGKPYSSLLRGMYKPSLVGLEFRIKEPKIPKILTGIEIRGIA